MKPFRLWLALGIVLVGYTTLAAAPGDISDFEVHSLSARLVLKAYEQYSGKPVIIPADVDVDTPRLSFRFTNKSRAEALRAIEVFLVIQAHIKIVHATDGTVTVKSLKAARQVTKPNQSPDPTPSPVTPVAGQPARQP
jgi:hypothetical protein